MTLAQISYTLRVLHLEMVPYRAEIRKSRIKGATKVYPVALLNAYMTGNYDS